MTEDANLADPKPPHLDRLSSLWRRIYDRKIVQWTVAYAAVAYGIQHAITLTIEPFELPKAIARISLLLFALGLPVVVTFAWYHGERASRRISGPELTIIAILLAASTMLFYVLVRPAERQPGVEAARTAAAAPAGTISLAVLPFLNLSSDKEQEFFSDGITEEITSALAKVPDLRIVARTSAFEFKGKNVNVKTMGEQLGATHLIEGSVRKAGDRLRITVQLIKADDGTHIWAEDYDRQLTDIFAVQEDIARSITTSLRMPLGLKSGENLVNNRTKDDAAYEDYLRAKALVRSRGGLRGAAPLIEASALLEEAVNRDPTYASAWSLLAEAYALLPDYVPAFYSANNDELRRIANTSLPKAEAAGRKAIELNPNGADGHASLGLAYQVRGNWLRAEDSLAKALELDPENPDAVQRYGNLLAGIGRLKEALREMQRLQILEPFVPIFTANTAFVLWLNGQDEPATRMLEGLPRVAARAVFLPEVYAASGRYSEAADAMLAMPSGTFLPGTVEAAANLLRMAPTVVASPQMLPRLGALAYVYLYVGATERALERQQDSHEAGYIVDITYASVWRSSYASLRRTGRFKRNVREIGLVDYWRAKGWPPQCHPTTGDDFECE
jgi:TolB-like protein